METKIRIQEEESHQVEMLFSRFNGYCSILGYLANYGSLDTSLFDKKWEEAIEINNELNKLKNLLDKKYHPSGDWNTFEFNFITQEIIYKC